MRRVVAGLAYVFEALTEVGADDVAEVLVVHEADQPVVIGHDQRAVNGVHPFDGKLHRPAAVKSTARRVDAINPLRRLRDLSKRRQLRVGEEAGEVGHWWVTSFVCYGTLNI